MANLNTENTVQQFADQMTELRNEALSKSLKGEELEKALEVSKAGSESFVKSVMNTTELPAKLAHCEERIGDVIIKTCLKKSEFLQFFTAGSMGDSMDIKTGAKMERPVLNTDHMFMPDTEWTTGDYGDCLTGYETCDPKMDKICAFTNRLGCRIQHSFEDLCESSVDWLSVHFDSMTDNLVRTMENMIINSDPNGTPNGDMSIDNINGPIANVKDKAVLMKAKGLRYQFLRGGQTYDSVTGSCFVDRPDSGVTHDVLVFSVEDISKMADLLTCSKGNPEDYLVIMGRKTCGALQRDDCLKTRDVAGPDATLFGNQVLRAFGYNIYVSDFIPLTDETGVVNADPSLNVNETIILVKRDAVYRGTGSCGTQFKVDEIPGIKGSMISMAAWFGFGICNGQAETGTSVVGGINVKPSL